MAGKHNMERFFAQHVRSRGDALEVSFLGKTELNLSVLISTIRGLMDKFGKYNDNESIKFVVADKDMIEWDAIREKLPSTALHYVFQ